MITTTRERLFCGCMLVADPDGNGQRAEVKCKEAAILWSELVKARDELNEAEDRGEKAGHKNRLDAFRAARERYHAHVRWCS